MLDTYNPKALKQITKKPRGSTLWIITLQTRHISRGEISILAEFQLMKNKVTAKKPLIYHVEVPDILIAETDRQVTSGNSHIGYEAKPDEPPPSKKE